MHESFGDFLKRVMKEKGLNQRRLALLIECSDANVSKLISGSRNPTLSMVEMILDAIGYHIEYVENAPEDNQNVAR